MTTTPNMSLVLPTDHSDSNIWGPILATLFTRVDLHDHSTGLGVKVPTAGLNINADLSFSPGGTPRALTDVKAIDFAAVASTAVTSYAGAFFVSDGTGGLVANELYFRTTSGTNVRFTNGAALNVAAFAGGIGGDYAAVGAAVAFDDAADRYTFKQQGNLWARMASGEVRILETGTTEALYVGLAAPAALAASFSITLPLAAPGSTSLVQMDSSGVLTASNTVANAVALSASLTVGTTLGVTGLITATAGVTAAANQHVTVSGTGRFKHGTRTQSMGASQLVIFAGGGGINTFSGYVSAGGTAIDVSAAIVLDVGKRLLATRVYVLDSATGPTTLKSELRSMTSVGGGGLIATSNTSTGSGAAQTLSITGLTTTIPSLTSYSLRVVGVAGTAAVTVLMIEVDYDEP